MELWRDKLLCSPGSGANWHDKMDYIGKLGVSTVCSATAVVVRFADGQVLEFESEQEARGFLAFYNRSPSASAQNQAKIYIFKSLGWEEQSG